MKTYDFSGHFESLQPLATCSADLMAREGSGKNADGSNLPTPIPHMLTAKGIRIYFPGTGVRGKLRRCTRDVLREAVMAATGTDAPFSLPQHYLLTLGGIKGSEEQERSNVKLEATWRSKNPALSLFGAGAAGSLGFVAGHLSVGNAVCEEAVAPVVFSGARTDDLYRDKEQARFLSDDDLDSLVAQAEGNKVRAKLQAERKKVEAKLKKGGTAAAKAELEAALADLNARIEANKKSSGTGDVAIGQPLAGWKAIPEGQTLNHRMLLVRSNPVELGLLLAALDRFAQLPVLGAKFANGCGLVKGFWEVFEVTPAGRVSLGTVTMDEFAPLVVNGEALTAARAAFQTWLASDQPDYSIPSAEEAVHG